MFPPDKAGRDHPTVEDLSRLTIGAVEAVGGHSLASRQDLIQMFKREEDSLDEFVPGVPLEGLGWQEDAVLNRPERLLVIVRWKT